MALRAALLVAVTLFLPTVAVVPHIASSKRHRAFTFIEATVTFIIIAIISSIAITSYEWAIGNAHNADSTQSLQAAALASGAYYTQHSSWPAFSVMPEVESAYAYVGPTTASTSAEQISVGTYSNMFDLAAYDSSTKTCFFLAVPPPGSSSSELRVSSTSVTCSAASMPGSGTSWP
jgi:Tfp pilus assembly protein PilE